MASVSADLYLNDLDGKPLDVYLAWRDNDSFTAGNNALAAHGYDTDRPIPDLPDHIKQLARSASDAAHRRHEQAERLLDPTRAEQVWIGQVSWMKATIGLQGGGWDDYVPGVVERLHSLYVDAPVLTRALLAETMVAFSVPDHSVYTDKHLCVEPRHVADAWRWGGPSVRRIRRGRHRMVVTGSRGVEKARPVKQWLEARIGHRIYPTSQ